MTRIMNLDESTRVNLLEHALRGFPSTRGPDNLRTVCEVAALSSEDPSFIGDMLAKVPNPEDCLAEWTLLAMRADHEVMMTVMADRFGLDWATARVPSRWSSENGHRQDSCFEHALIEHDAVRMFTTAVERGWTVPSAARNTAQPGQPWLVNALQGKAEKIADQLMAYESVAQDHHHLTQALQYLSVSRYEHDGAQRPFVTGWWARLVNAGVDPWAIDGRSHLWTSEQARHYGPTPGHRMLQHALNQLGDHRFRGEGQAWLEALNATLTWDDAPIVDGQSLPAFALAHPKLGTRDMWGGGADSLGIGERLLDVWAQQGTSLVAGSPDANPVEMLIAPYLTLGRPSAPPAWQVSAFDRDKPPVPLLFDRVMDRLAPWANRFPDGALDGPAIERLAQRVVGRLTLRRDWVDSLNRSSQKPTEDERTAKNQEWRDGVALIHDRLKRLDRWVVPSVRVAWQAWTQEWYDAWSSWPSVPDDQIKSEGPRRAERIGLRAVFLANAEAPAVEARLRNRL